MGGGLAHVLGLPMPFLIGSLAAVAGVAIAAEARFGRRLTFPQPLRKGFVAIIGAMIGATFSRDLLEVLPHLWVSLLAMIPFVVIAHLMVYRFFLWVGRYDQPTAFFAAVPGGLIETVEMGEKAGADPRVLSLQHFARIVLVVLIVPIGFQLWSGHAVGSAAGQAMTNSAPAAATSMIQEIAIITALAAGGLVLARIIRLPAGHLMGPLLLSAVVHTGGLTSATGPAWLLNVSQVVVGGGLGALFAGASIAMLVRAFSLGAGAVGLTLGLGLGFAFVLSTISVLSPDALIISFAPGGVTEMGLIALSLGISPVPVAVHHLSRIILTVVLAAAMWRRR